MFTPHAKCTRDCLKCKRSTCQDVRPVPGMPRPEECEPTNTKVQQLEACIKECRVHLTTMDWTKDVLAMVDIIDKAWTPNPPGSLFKKD